MTFNALATPRRLRLRGTKVRWNVYHARKELRLRLRAAEAEIRALEEDLYGPARSGRFERQIIFARHWAEDAGWVR